VQRLQWRPGTVVGLRDETLSARTIVLEVPDWPGHLAGQHVDVRLTAPDGYTATRSYSLASAAAGSRVAVTVERVDGGEVSPYLAGELAVGDVVELLGPVGGWFVWHPRQQDPVQLIGGGSGVVPLMSMARSHVASGAATPLRLLYSARDAASVIYADELSRPPLDAPPRAVTLWYTRRRPDEAPAGRLEAETLTRLTLSPSEAPLCYVCGSNGFVEAVAGLLVAAGHDPARVRTERFGPMGGTR
jgi:ferredoxin-NADP reductase